MKTPRGILAERAYRYSSLESEALTLRLALGFKEPSEPIDGLRVFDLIQNLQVDVGGKAHRVFCRVDKLPDGMEAKAMYNVDTSDYDIVLDERTYDWLESGYPRGKSSLIHECSHVWLHPNLLQKLSTLPLHSRAALYRGDAVPHQFCRDTEWQADALTSAITMPAKGIAILEAEHRDVQWQPMERAIAEHFGVSGEAADYRWQNYRTRKAELLRV